MIPRLSVFNIILIYFGRALHKLVNNYVNENLRRINIQETLYFNKKCKSNNILPKSLLQRPPIRTPQGFQVARGNAFRYLNCYIQDGYKKLKSSNHKLNQLRQQILDNLPYYIIDDLDNYISHRKIIYKRNINNRLREKYNNLANIKFQKNTTNKNLVLNLSSKQLTDMEKLVLEKGLNYSLQNDKANYPKFIASVENIIEEINNISCEEKTILRHQISNAIKPIKNKNNLDKEEVKALKALKSDRTISIVPADKDQSIVILNKNDYIDKVEDHLSDRSIYKPINNDPNSKLRTIINSFLKLLKEDKSITENQYFKLFAKCASLPMFYGLIKTHKNGNPIRPIVAFIGSPTYNVAKFLSNILTPLTENCVQKLKNSYDLKDKIENIQIPSTHSLVSYDVKALFTSIPQDFALNCIYEFMQTNSTALFNATRIKISDLYHLIKICLDATTFSYNKKLYKQVTGTPMGSPVSVVISEIVMQKIEEKIFDKYDFLFWYRFVDDVLACINTNNINNSILNINKINENIQFTIEV